ncbi:MAG TPA: c-type cytochrome [Candidatus Dormibacteraeota bacterium]|nr:c-type cytochrome [Candidatus Dormibacteraeota bacterium]
MKISYSTSVLVALLLMAAGCGPQNNASGPKPKTGKTAAAAVIPVTRVSFSELAVSPKPDVTPGLIEQGKTVYSRNCAACHGVKGDGNGDAAAFLLPKPRNFVEAKYRLRSTPTGELPTDVDLFRAVSLGMPGTPMPPWKHSLSESDRWAVVEYIKTFSPRFSDPAETKTVIALGAPAPKTEATIAEGKELFKKLSCFSCHGEFGHGDGPSAPTLVDDRQLRIKPRDFARPSGFKSGYSTKEIARVVLTGFNGTPMAGFHGQISEADAWKLAYYVESFARPEATSPAGPASQNFLVREQLGEPDVRIKVTERAWTYDPSIIRVKKGQVVEITFEPTDNGLGVGHGLAISGYDESVFLNGAMVGVPKVAKFRADHAGKFTFYCATQCSTEKLHPQMNGSFIVEEDRQTASLQ